ncbi:MAG: MGMT family protein [Bryobacterales bacterium]|nr:MGMT family protein [Bryobacterales bacterium]MDE0263551.1 MGMT family protein [Bryobacterales bacterium]
MPRRQVRGGAIEVDRETLAVGALLGGRTVGPAWIRYQEVWSVVAQIPRGRVATYGDVARMAGIAGGARQAGRAMRLCPPELALPWHRVLAAGGRIALSGERAREQRRRLERENVPFAGARVRLERCRWEPETAQWEGSEGATR